MYDLKEKRLYVGLTTRATARHLGISVRQYNRIENNYTKKPMTKEKAEKLADIFNCTVAEVRLREGFINGLSRGIE